jgi:hypothetical protein
MKAMNFDQPELLAKYVTDNGIIITQIAQIVNNGGTWWIFYFTA